jgi:hypothetical protein
MARIAVIGNAGGGKTTMCAKLGQTLNIAIYPIDKIQWKPGWVSTPLQEFHLSGHSLLPFCSESCSLHGHVFLRLCCDSYAFNVGSPLSTGILKSSQKSGGAPIERRAIAASL